MAAIYIHIPYCRAKCRYCSFVSYPCKGEGSDAYWQALLKQLRDMALHPWSVEREFSTLFIGGGTPTIYDGKSLSFLIEECLTKFHFQKNPEITIETNPESATLVDLQQCREAGVNRLSIGVQSFDDDLLTVLGRVHSSVEAGAAIATARQAGFDNINLDLMYGLPGQSLDSWMQSVDTAINFAPEHVAFYELTIEDGTPFGKLYKQNKLDLPDEDVVSDMEEAAWQHLAAAGYDRYEISNFARRGRRCQHNINYWQNGSYLGLGAGAVMCLSGLRLRAVEEPQEYIRRIDQGLSPFYEVEGLAHDASFRETVIMGLRMLDGVDLAELKHRFDLEPLAYYGDDLQRLLDDEMVVLEDGFLRLSAKSIPVANQVLSVLV